MTVGLTVDCLEAGALLPAARGDRSVSDTFARLSGRATKDIRRTPEGAREIRGCGVELPLVLVGEDMLSDLARTFPEARGSGFPPTMFQKSCRPGGQTRHT